MRIALLCATQRGVRFLERLRRLCPSDDLTVFSFREDPSEPRYLDDIHRFAEEHGMQFFETKSMATPLRAAMEDTAFDLLLMVHWRYLVPMSLLNNVRLGSIVLHDSLLPTYRGFSPTVWSIINGEQNCGATMLYAAHEVDAGDIIDQERVAIAEDETISNVMDKVTSAYLSLLDRNIQNLKSGHTLRIRQDQSLATFTCKRMPEDNLIDWRQSTRMTFNLVRAVSHPYPGAFTFLRGAKMTIWSAQPFYLGRRYVGTVPGRVIEVKPGEGIVVLTGDGALLVRTVQFADGPELCAADVVKSVTAKLG